MYDRFEWDPKKDKANIKKHGISFARAATIFADDILSFKDKRKNYGEIRTQTIGRMTAEEDIFVILVAHTNRQGAVRIISARIANKKERKKYYEHLEKKHENFI